MHRVVVGLSGAPAGARTLAWGIAEALTTGAELVVVHGGTHPGTAGNGIASLGMPWTGATDPVRLGTGPVGRGTEGRGPGRQHHPASRARGSLSSLELVDRAAASAVAAARRRLGEASVGIVVEPGPAGDALIRAAGPNDLIVLGPPGRVGWWARGSTTYQVVTHARCPVVVVHDDAAGAAAARESGGQVVVGCAGPAGPSLSGVDFGGPLAYGFGYAAAHGLPLLALRVVASADEGDSGAVDLAAQTQPWQRRYPSVPVRRMVLHGHPIEGLRREADHAAILVIGGSSSARGGAMGSVARSLGRVGRSMIASAACPVAVVPDPAARA